MCENFGNSGGEGGNFRRPILENPEGRWVIRQIPSVGGGGRYGYFLEPHIAIVNVAGNKGMYQRFSTFFANIFPYPPDIVQIK